MRTAFALAVLGVVAAAGEARIIRHDLNVAIDPQKSSFGSVDRIEVEGPGTLRLPSMKGISVEADGLEGGTLEVPAGRHTYTFTFRGSLANPVQKQKGPTWVAGDETPGTIGERGSYLVRGFFVPSSRPAALRITIDVPLPHRAVAQGRRVAESEKDGHYRVTFESKSTDGVVVATGPWVVTEEKIGETSCRTYLYEADKEHAAILLSSLSEEIPRFTALFGPVPGGRFDVVENFFATGYGFANFTLLGDTVIRYVCAKAKRERLTALPAGYLDHELVHCWLGNHVLVAYDKGNWCEALTTYFTNYGAAEREKRDAAYRRKVSRMFSLKVRPEADYPLVRFREKRHDYENDIGYGKGSMVFHMLNRELGRDVFLEAVRHLVESRGGRAIGWDGLVAALSEGAGRDLEPWFKAWLERTGAPFLELGRLHVQGNRVTGTLLQAHEGRAYPLRVPIRVVTETGLSSRRSGH